MNSQFLKHTSKFFLPVILILSSSGLQATEKVALNLFYSHESNGADYFSSVGVGTTFKQRDTNIGFQLSTSIGNAEVLATDGYVEEFVSWEGSVKLGYFSNLSFYIESGIDLSELFFKDLREDDYYDDYDSDYHDDLDSFVGVGAGIKTGNLQIDAFYRIREIDSEYWEAESEVFSGIRATISF